jgi:hypothetical protein
MPSRWSTAPWSRRHDRPGMSRLKYGAERSPGSAGSSTGSPSATTPSHRRETKLQSRSRSSRRQWRWEREVGDPRRLHIDRAACAWLIKRFNRPRGGARLLGGSHRCAGWRHALRHARRRPLPPWRGLQLRDVPEATSWRTPFSGTSRGSCTRRTSAMSATTHSRRRDSTSSFGVVDGCQRRRGLGAHQRSVRWAVRVAETGGHPWPHPNRVKGANA